MKTKLFLTIICLLTLCACSINNGNTQDTLKEEFKSIEAVQLIKSGNENPYDESTRLQPSYIISANSKLLMKLIEIEGLANDTDLSQGKVILRVVLTSGQSDVANQFKLYPVTREWAMGATWKRAYPFGGKSSQWITEGGDVDTAGTIVGSSEKPNNTINPPTALTPTPTPSPTPPSVKGVVYFDITEWYLNYLKGRNQNYGFMLTVTGGDYEIYGDRTGTYSPRIYWYKLINPAKTIKK